MVGQQSVVCCSTDKTRENTRSSTRQKNYFTQSLFGNLYFGVPLISFITRKERQKWLYARSAYYSFYKIFVVKF